MNNIEEIIKSDIKYKLNVVLNGTRLRIPKHHLNCPLFPGSNMIYIYANGSLNKIEARYQRDGRLQLKKKYLDIFHMDDLSDLNLIVLQNDTAIIEVH